MWKGWTVGLLGILQFVLGFFRLSAKAFVGEYILVGLIVAIVGFMMLADKRKWQGWLAGLSGIWLIISAFIPGLNVSAGAFSNCVIVGTLIVAAGFGALTKTEQAE